MKLGGVLAQGGVVLLDKVPADLVYGVRSRGGRVGGGVGGRVGGSWGFGRSSAILLLVDSITVSCHAVWCAFWLVVPKNWVIWLRGAVDSYSGRRSVTSMLGALDEEGRSRLVIGSRSALRERPRATAAMETNLLKEKTEAAGRGKGAKGGMQRQGGVARTGWKLQVRLPGGCYPRVWDGFGGCGNLDDKLGDARGRRWIPVAGEGSARVTAEATKV